MTRHSRLIFQLLTWWLIWLLLDVVQGPFGRFLSDNWAGILLQTVLLIGLVYALVPRLLLAKKYGLFVLISLIVIVGATYLAIEINTPPQRLRTMPGRPAPPGKFLTVFLFLFISLAVASFIEILVHARNKEAQLIAQHNAMLSQELQLLKSQINPHFLFNSLNNIYALSVLDSDKTQQSISHLSEMLRYVIYDCQQPWVPLSKEVEYIGHYIALYQLKRTAPFGVETDFGTVSATTKVAPMILLPFVENAYKHSGIDTFEDAFIRIQLKEQQSAIEFICENSYSKNSTEKDKVGGVGLDNVKKRLAIQYSDSHQLEIETSQHFKVMLKLPLDGTH